MPSTAETGHAKNVANFETLISFCIGYGAAYNPSRDSLKIANLHNPSLPQPKQPLLIAKPKKLPSTMLLTLVEHFNGLIELVSSHTEYNPNEEELKVTALQTLLTQLKADNISVINTHTDWSNSRLTRDNVLYADTTGLVDTALNVKGYVKSLFGATSPQFAQVKGIEFKRGKN